MRYEYFKIKKLLRKRQELYESACSVGSPGFEPHYNSSRKTSAPFENKLLDVCDIEEEIDAAFRAFVKSIEYDNNKFLTEAKGQRQRVLRLYHIANKREGYISELLGVTEQTVKNRLAGNIDEFEGDDILQENQLLVADEYVERYIAWMYRTLQCEIGEQYNEVERLIAYHEDCADTIRSRYEARVGRMYEEIDRLKGRARNVVELRLNTKDTWNNISAAAGCTSRHAKRLFRKFYENFTLLG